MSRRGNKKYSSAIKQATVQAYLAGEESQEKFAGDLELHAIMVKKSLSGSAP